MSKHLMGTGLHLSVHMYDLIIILVIGILAADQ